MNDREPSSAPLLSAEVLSAEKELHESWFPFRNWLFDLAPDILNDTDTPEYDRFVGALNKLQAALRWPSGIYHDDPTGGSGA